jgi:hypothetical protein
MDEDGLWKIVQNAKFAPDVFKPKRKGLQLALEPLNGRGIAGYVPQTGVMDATLVDRVPGELTYCKRARCAR